MSDWTTERVRIAIVRALNPLDGVLMTEFDLDGGRCDVVQLSKSGYATEYEIKVSRADWRADADKQKWRHERQHIRRFYYVVLAEMVDPGLGELGIPSWVNPLHGIMTVTEWGGRDVLRTIRKASLCAARKVGPEVERRALLAAYYRYWRHFGRMQEVRDQLRERRVACAKCHQRMRCPECDGYIKTRDAA